MSEKIRVLIVEDDPVDADLMIRELRRGGYEPESVRVETEADYLAELEKDPEVILSDSRLPLFDGLEALHLLNKKGLDIPFILVSGRMGEDLAVEAMKSGACDYLLKDRLARLGEAVRRAVDDRSVRAERTWAVGALRQSEERYRLVSEATSDYVYSLKIAADGSPRCEWITERFNRITGYDIEEINRIGWMNLYHPEDRALAIHHAGYLREGKSDSMDVRILTRDRQIRWMRVFERPAPRGEKDQKVAGIYGAAQDITIQKQLEEQLILAQKMEAIGQLAGGVAHDFNNLLTVICGYGDLLKKLPGLTAEAQEYTDEILQAARRAAQLTRQLLAFGRRQMMLPKTLDLNTIVKDLEKLLRRLIGEDVALKIVCSADPAFVRIDPGQIEQVMMNLAVNARDAMPNGGRLVIETANVDFDKNAPGHKAASGDGTHILLSVSDTGTGMDAETAARVFEPFFTTKEPGKGTGLGLAMAYGIVTQSGGEIRVDTQAGRGTTFRIYLPRVEPEANPEAEAIPFELHPGRHGETILVLEDEESLRALIRQVLSSEGHTVLDTGDPDEAIQLCRAHAGEITMLIADIVLPKMSGPQAAMQIAQICPDVNIIYTSGYPGKAQGPGNPLPDGSEFLEKPFSADTLLRKVRAVLEGSGK